MKRIKLTNGGHALVDNEDYERFGQMRWKAQKGYPCIGNGKVKIYLHRLVMQAPPGQDVDHVNGNTYDARKANLRFCNDSQNQANRRKVVGRVPIKGVCIHGQTGKYQAQVKKDGKSHYLGLFTCRIEAGRAYIKKARELHGDFAWSNIREQKEAA